MKSIIAVLLLIFSNGVIKSSPENNEKNVLQNYLRDYDKRVRPKPDNNRALVVKLSVDTVKLIGYDTDSHLATLALRVYFEWSDKLHSWKPDDFGTSSFLVPAKDIWQPDFRLTNGESTDAYPSFESYATVHSDGDINLSSYIKSSVMCSVDKGNVSCPLIFGSLSLLTQQLNFELLENSTTNLHYEQYDGSPILLQNIKVTLKPNATFDCCPEEQYSRVHVTVEASYRQKNNFLAFAFVPMFIFTFLVMLQFLIPPNIGERVVYGILVIILIVIYGYYVCTLSLAWDYGLFNLSVAYVFCMALGAASALTNTCLVVNFHHARHNVIMPTWMKRLFLRYLPPILLMPDERDRVERDLSSKRQSTKRTEPKNIVEIEAEQPLLSEDGQTGQSPVRAAERRRLLLTGAELVRLVRELSFGLNVRLAEVRGNPQWVYAARVVNRLGLATLSFYFLLCHLIVLLCFWSN